MTRAQPSWMIQSVERMAAILDLFTVEEPMRSEQEIVSATGLSRGTVYRFCQTLRHLGYLEVDAEGRYRPGSRAITLGQAAISSLDVAELARPLAARLREETGQTVNMAVPDGEDIVFVIRIRGTSLLDLRVEVGSRLPAYCTSLGRAMLSCLPDDELETYLRTAHLEARTERTIVDRDELRSRILGIREVGYAVNDGELESALRGVAAPIRYADGRPAAALNIALTRPFAPNELETVLAPKIVAAADAVTRLLAGGR